MSSGFSRRSCSSSAIASSIRPATKYCGRVLEPDREAAAELQHLVGPRIGPDRLARRADGERKVGLLDRGRDGGRRCRAAASRSDRRDVFGQRALEHVGRLPDPAIAAGRRAPARPPPTGRADRSRGRGRTRARRHRCRRGRAATARAASARARRRHSARSRGAWRRSPRRCVRCAPRRARGDTTISARRSPMTSPSRRRRAPARRCRSPRRSCRSGPIAPHRADPARGCRVPRARRRATSGATVAEAFNRRQRWDAGVAHATDEEREHGADDAMKRRETGLGAGGWGLGGAGHSTQGRCWVTRCWLTRWIGIA